MTRLLHIDSSSRGALSTTQTLTAHFAHQWQQAHSDGTIVYRNLADSNLQFVTAELIGSFYTPADQLTAAQKQLLAQSDQLAEEFIAADEYLLGVPMYNFSVPAVFKAYIDLVARVGKTFSYEGGRPRGLLTNKKMTIVTASGGDYSAGPAKSMDFVEPYLRAIMNFMGITDCVGI